VIPELTADDYEQDEPRIGPKPIQELETILVAASAIAGKPIELGDVAPYFGELSITWCNNDKMVRITAFSDTRVPRLDFGSICQFFYDREITGQDLATQLEWLHKQCWWECTDDNM